MTPPGITDQVIAYYDTHPINEQQILRSLAARGIALDGLTEEILKDHDQDHYGGTGANDALIAAAGITSAHWVLDVCSGMGGPARYLAHRVGCRVVGLDLTESRYLSAQRLTKLVGLDGLVSFRHGNALEMPFADASFDVVIGQEAWCHVPDKGRLISECARVVKPGGVIAFTDILRLPALSDAEMARLTREMTFPSLESFDGYAQLLTSSGCTVTTREDLSAHWARLLQQRLEMYRGLREPTIAEFGAEHYEHWDRIYSYFVGLYQEDKLGGGRFVARRLR